MRTPDERFEQIEGFDFEPRWLELPGGLRMGYVSEGPPNAPVVVLVHGEPTWGFLYRRLIPPLVASGLRVVVPDLVGFGRSDKPSSVGDYSFAGHVEWLRAALFDVLDVAEIYYVGQDWGGLLGMRLLAEHPERFAGVVMSNTGLPTGDVAMPLAWQRFRDMVRTAERLDIARMVDAGCLQSLTAAARAAYDAPFPAPEYCAGVRAFPELVPNTPDDPASQANRQAWATLSRLSVPFLCAFSDSDPLTRGGDGWMRSRIPGAADREHAMITGAGHFLQEDQPDGFADVISRFVNEQSVAAARLTDPPG